MFLLEEYARILHFTLNLSIWYFKIGDVFFTIIAGKPEALAEGFSGIMRKDDVGVLVHDHTYIYIHG